MWTVREGHVRRLVRSAWEAVVVLVVACHSGANAAGETAAQFLMIPVGARASAMGGAFVAVADDPSAMYWNPSGMTQMSSAQLFADYNIWLLNMSYQYVAGVYPGAFGTLGAAIAYSSSGKIPMYVDFQRVGEYTAYDAAASLAYAGRAGSLFSYGISVKALRLVIEEEGASGVAIDVGLHHRFHSMAGLAVGVTAQNLGPDVKFIDQGDPLPLAFRGGLSYRRGSISVTGDLGKFRDSDVRVNVGGEVRVHDVLALRTGYDFENTYSVGLGLIWRAVSLDYAFVPYEDIGETHRVSLKLDLGRSSHRE